MGKEIVSSRWACRISLNTVQKAQGSNFTPKDIEPVRNLHLSLGCTQERIPMMMKKIPKVS